MPRNTELSRMRSPKLHQDTVVPVGLSVHYGSAGALNVAVPSGATGILMQQHHDRNNPLYSDVIYWTFNAVNTPITINSVDGFLLDSGAVMQQTVWFDPNETKYFNFWINSADVELHYRFIRRADGVR